MKLFNKLNTTIVSTALQCFAFASYLPTHASPTESYEESFSNTYDHFQKERQKIVQQTANTVNSTCHQISSDHTLCIQNHNQNIDPYLIAKRYKQVIQVIQDTLNLPNKLRKTKGFDHLIIQNNQQNLKLLMKSLKISYFWGYYQEDFFEKDSNAIFAFTPQSLHTKEYNSPWMYSNIAHEMGHAAFSVVIQNTEVTKELLNKININPRVILEGFAEFIKYANSQEPKYKISGLENSYGIQCFQFPEIYNPELTQKTKIYSINNLLNLEQKPNSDYYYYGKIFFNFIYKEHKGLYNLLLLGLLKKSDLALKLFRARVLTKELNKQFIDYQRFYIFTHNKLDVLLRFHTRNIYEEQN